MAGKSAATHAHNATRAQRAIEKIEHACWRHYIQTGEPATIKEITKRAGMSEGTVRKYIQECERIDWTQISVSRRSEAFGNVIGHRMVDAVQPSREWMRRSIIEGEIGAAP